MAIHRPYEKKPKQLEDEVPVPRQLATNTPELPNTQQEAGSHVNEGNKPAKNEKATNKPSKGSTEYGQTIEKRGGLKKNPNTPPDSWKAK